IQPCRPGGIVIQIRHVHHKSVAIPLRTGVSEEEVVALDVSAAVQINAALAMNELIAHLDHLGALCDLEWKRNVVDARYPGLPAPAHGIVCAVFKVGFSSGFRFGLVRDHTVGSVRNGSLSGVNIPRSCMRLDASIERIIENLPDAAEIRMIIRSARNST